MQPDGLDQPAPAGDMRGGACSEVRTFFPKGSGLGDMISISTLNPKPLLHELLS